MKNVIDQDKDNGMLTFYCPGCEMPHSFDKRWTFNGNLEKPTFSPSLLVRYTWGPERIEMRCHSFVREGKIQFLNDCTHKLAGKTVDMEKEIWK